MKTVAAAQREVSNRVTASLAQQFGEGDGMTFDGTNENTQTSRFTEKELP
jgi:hypothetical protein